MAPSWSSSAGASLPASGAIAALSIVEGVFVDCAAVEKEHVKAFVQIRHRFAVIEVHVEACSRKSGAGNCYVT